ncbi:hypothetical protein FRC00_001023 [Tulasnella sp. 408]|nr:hypothetical protein FRC00_001023 [Tulasnella sp. 408]
MDFKDVEDVDIKILDEYRAWAFPQAVSDPNHRPYLSLEDPTSWATLDALKLFFWSKISPEVVPNTSTVSFLPKEFLLSSYFSLENRENWTKLGPIQAFRNAGLLAPQAASNPSPRSPSHLMKNEDQIQSPRIFKNADFKDPPNWTEAIDDPWRKAPSGTADDPVPVDSSPSESERQPDPSPNHPEDWLTPNKSRTIRDAHPSLWTLMVDPGRLGRPLEGPEVE